MATPTYDLLDSTTLGTAASSVTFSSIDQSYRDLVLVCNFTLDDGSKYAYGQLNGDTSTSYGYVYMRGTGSAAQAGAGTTPFFGIGVGDTTTSTLARLQLMDYSATDKHKTILGRLEMVGDSRTRADVHRWANTAAVTTILLAGQSSSNFQAGSTFYLYGIAS